MATGENLILSCCFSGHSSTWLGVWVGLTPLHFLSNFFAVILFFLAAKFSISHISSWGWRGRPLQGRRRRTSAAVAAAVVVAGAVAVAAGCCRNSARKEARWKTYNTKHSFWNMGTVGQFYKIWQTMKEIDILLGSFFPWARVQFCSIVVT